MRTRPCLSFLLVLCALLGAGRTPALPPQLADFLRESARGDESAFAALLGRINPYQLPLSAVAVNAEERSSGAQEHAYEALTRWHFWLSSQLDAEGDGLWALRSFGALPEAAKARRESAVIAGLQQLQLRALTEMATRRGRMVDALAWARELRLLERQMIARLYDPVLGAYVDVDSLGMRIPNSADTRSLITIGLGAPTLRGASRELATRALFGDAPAADDVRSELMLLLDPLGNWWRSAGSSELGPATAAFFLRRGLSLMGAPELASEVESVLRVYGIESRDARPQLGPIQLTLQEPALRATAFVRSEAALGFFFSEGLVARDELAALRERIDEFRAGGCPSDSVATPLLRALSRWRQASLEPSQNSFLREGETLPPPVNGEGAGAFRYSDGDRALWTSQALDALTEDLLALYLVRRHDASYAAAIEPLAVAMGSAPTLQLTRLDRRDGQAWPGENWRGAWTDGRHIKPSSALRFSTIDSLHARATLPAPPEQKGLWWLVLSGPRGLPREALGVSVVDPLLAEVLADGAPAPDGTQRLRVTLTNYTRSRLNGRTEMELPANWQAVPSNSESFSLEPGQSATSRFVISPDELAQAGQYPLRVRFLVDGRSLQEQRLVLGIPYQWITLGPFAEQGEQGLRTRTPGDESLDLSARYQLLDGKRGWEHLQRDAIASGGWIQLAAESDPRGIYFARSVLSSASREVLIQFESSAPAEFSINGTRLLQADPLSGSLRAESVLDYGANHLQVRMLGGGGAPVRFRLSLRDIEGGPLIALENRLERLLDGYAYVRGSAARGGEDLDEGDRFVLVPIVYNSRGVRSVAVVGSFNGWSPSATPMVDLGDGRWKAEIRLPLGRFEYKLAVDGVRWIADPGNPVAVPDGFGGRNSVLILE